MRLAWLALLPGFAQGAPFLVSDPYPASAGVDRFEVTVDGKASTSAPQTMADGSERPHYDLAGLGNGQHTASIKACGQWGCGAASSPFTFVVGVPSAPTGLGISAN